MKINIADDLESLPVNQSIDIFSDLFHKNGDICIMVQGRDIIALYD